MTTENVTILFTDLVGSTQLQSSVTPDVADALRRDHFTVLRRAIADSGGREVKNLGDGLMVVFSSASAAIAGAVAMQQGVELDGRTGSRPIDLRVGLAGGEVTREDDDYFGDPVIEAARLCARCEAGQILATELVRLTAGRRNPHRHRSLGGLELKGLPDPVDAIEVLWEPLEGTEDEITISLPSLLQEEGRFPFAGRAHEVARLLGAWESVTTGATRLALIAGEPGVGKTRLTAELAARVARSGGIVFGGRCDELVGIPYQPFVEALRGQLARSGGSDCLGSAPGELVRLVPELSRVLPDLPSPVDASTESERMALFGSVRSWLESNAGQHPVLLVVDDLHWADMGSLLLMRHVVANDPVPGLLVVGTYRDTDLDRTHPLAMMLADLHRRGDVERITMSGLDDQGVADLMTKTAGHELDEAGAALARTLHQDTGGNPFFVGEVLRHLAERGSIAQEGGRWVAGRDDADIDLPEGIRQVVGRRLSVLPEETQRALSSASVIGARFDLDLLSAVTDTRGDDLLDALDPALDAHLLLETGVGRYQFAHALVRSTLHAELSTTRRSRLHLSVAEALEKLHVADLDAAMSDLAYHWGETGDASGDASFAYARRAAELAMERAAPDEAVRWYRIARERLDGADPAMDAELQLELGLAESGAGEPGWQETLLGAARALLERGDVQSAATALTHSQRVSFTSVSLVPANAAKVELLERAIGLAADHPFLLALLTFELATEALIAGDFDRRDVLYERAMGLRAHINELNRRVFLECSNFPTASVRSRRSDDHIRRIAETTELLQRATEETDPEHLHRTAYMMRAFSSMAVRPMDRWEHIGAYEAHLKAHPDPVRETFLLLIRATAQLIDGRFDEVLVSADACERVATVFGNPDFATIASVLRLQCIREGTGFAPVIDPLLELLSDLPDDESPTAPVAIRTLVLAESGRKSEAADLIVERGRHSFVDIPDDSAFVIALSCWAEASALVGDRRSCRALADLVQELGDVHLATGGYFGGATSRYLAILSSALGDDDSAEGWFAQAERDHLHAESPPWLARTRVDWAEQKLATGDLPRAEELARAALDAIGDLELTVTRDRAARIVGFRGAAD